MAKWKKCFRKIPYKVREQINSIAGNDVCVVALKILTAAEIQEGSYSHLNLQNPSVPPQTKWEIVPPITSGRTSKNNVEGWEEVRKDLPKYTKYRYHDIQNFGDASRNGWSTVAIPREVYHRDSFPPFLFHIEVEVLEKLRDGSLSVSFRIDEIFDKKSASFWDDIHFAINLLQENCGVHGVSATSKPSIPYSNNLAWEIFPPGNFEEVVAAICQTGNKSQPANEDAVRDRLQLFKNFEPTEYLRGLGGNDRYIGAKYADDLVAFENFKHGNALYIMYDNWDSLAKKSRRELLRMPTKNFDRIVHTVGWQNTFAVLMKRELRERGVHIRIGRNQRRRA